MTDTTTPARTDGWYSPTIGLGVQSDGLAQSRYYARPPLTSVDQDALMNTNAIARRIASLGPEDCTRMGVVFAGEDIDAQEIEKCCDRLNVLGSLRAAMTYARAYGGAVIIALTEDAARLPDGRVDMSAPLIMSTIERVNGWLVLDRWDCSVLEWVYDPASPIGIVPTSYNVAPMYGLPTSQVHASRVMPLLGVQAPPRVRVQMYSYWGPSVFDDIFDDLRNYQVGGEFVARMLQQSSVGVLSSQHIANAISSGNGDALVARLEALQEAMSALNMMAIDKDSESFAFAGRPITGVGDAMQQAKERLVSASGIPTSLLFGETKGGLNSGENAGEIRAWYAHCASDQESLYRHPLRWMIDLILSAKRGPTRGVIPPDLSFQFRPLWEPDEATKATTRKTQAEARAIDIQAGIISTDEARRDDPSIAETYPSLDISSPAASASPLLPALGGASLLGAWGGTGSGAAGGRDLPADDLPVTDDLPPEDEAIVSVREAAESVGVKASNVRSWIKAGSMRAWRPGARYMVLVSEARECLRGARVQPFGPGAEPA
jgi:phage-related protein (TIGR01555 family)